MGTKRRHVDGRTPSGTTAVILVAADESDADAVAIACRHALRETDAVLARRDGGVTSLLLRNLRHGRRDAQVVADRVMAQIEAVGADGLRIGVAVSEVDAEPLDLLVRRAEADLEGTQAATPADVRTTP